MKGKAFSADLNHGNKSVWKETDCPTASNLFRSLKDRVTFLFWPSNELGSSDVYGVMVLHILQTTLMLAL